MAKHSKRPILLIVLTLCAALCFGLFAACDNNKPTDTSITYTVTVMKDATEAATGVKVTVTKSGVTFDEPKTTNDVGKVEFSLAPDTYEVKLDNLPEQYVVPTDANLTMTADDHDITITLAKKDAYEIKLVNPDGTPYTGNVGVVVCTLTGTCLEPVTPTNGVAYNYTAPKGDYHVKIEDLPAGYTYEKDTDGYYTGKNFSATDMSMTITIYPITTVDLSATPMTEDEINEYISDSASYGLDTRFDAYKFSKTLAAGASAYYTITPTISGQYTVYDNDTCNYYFDGTTFKATASNDAIFNQYMTLTAGNTYYFKVVNIGTATANSEFVITVPASTYAEYDGVNADNLELSVGKANTVAIVAFKPTQAGVYKVTAQGATPVILDYSNNMPSAFLSDTPADSDYAAGANIEINYSPAALKGNGKIFITVAAKAATYPADVAVKIERTGNSPSTYSYAEVESTLTQYADTENYEELLGIPVNGSAELEYDDENDCYTYNGKTVVVLITKAIDEDRFSDGYALAYIGMNSQTGYPVTYEVTKSQASGDGEDVINYTKFLRGFENYEQNGRNQEIPEELDEENCYANFVNSDGVYPLNKELKDFLVDFYAANKPLNAIPNAIPLNAAAGYEWMFPLYYYGYEAIGTYDCNYEDEDYVLVVYENGTFSLDVAGDYGYNIDSGTWSKNADGYSFVCDGAENYGSVLTYNNGEFTYTDDSEMDLTLAPSVDPIVGKYTGEIDGSVFTLTINSDGTYEIADEYGPYESGVWTAGDDDTYTFKGKAPYDEEFIYIYTVYVTDGTLEFFDDPDAFEPFYTFEPASDKEVLHQLQTSDTQSAMLTIYSDNTFELSIMGRLGYTVIASGTYNGTFEPDPSTYDGGITAITFDGAGTTITVHIVQNELADIDLTFDASELI